MVGGDERQRQEAWDELDRRARSGGEDRLAGFEVELTEDEREAVRVAQNAVDEIVAHYGGNPKPTENIHALNPGAVEELTEGKLRYALYNFQGQYIAVERRESLTDFALAVSHELLHLKSYKAAQVGPDGEIWPYRSGLQAFTTGAEEVYFDDLEEAIVSETNRRIFRSNLAEHPLFANEVHATQQLHPWLKKLMAENQAQDSLQDTVLEEIPVIPGAEDILRQLEESTKSEESKIGYLAGRLAGLKEVDAMAFHERYRERQQFYEVLDRILAASGGEFQNRDKVFEAFARANFSGKLLPLARMIEATLGKGAFRELAGKTQLEGVTEHLNEGEGPE